MHKCKVLPNPVSFITCDYDCTLITNQFAQLYIFKGKYGNVPDTKMNIPKDREWKKMKSYTM